MNSSDRCQSPLSRDPLFGTLQPRTLTYEQRRKLNTPPVLEASRYSQPEHDSIRQPKATLKTKPQRGPKYLDFVQHTPKPVFHRPAASISFSPSHKKVTSQVRTPEEITSSSRQPFVPKTAPGSVQRTEGTPPSSESILDHKSSAQNKEVISSGVLTAAKKQSTSAKRTKVPLFYKWVLPSMAVLLFVAGTAITVQTFRTNKGVQAQVTGAAVNQTEENPNEEDAATPSEIEPSPAQISSYRVDPSAPRYLKFPISEFILEPTDLEPTNKANSVHQITFIMLAGMTKAPGPVKTARYCWTDTHLASRV